MDIWEESRTWERRLKMKLAWNANEIKATDAAAALVLM